MAIPEWRSTRSYAEGDLAALGGVVYMALTSSVNKEPTVTSTYWATQHVAQHAEVTVPGAFKTGTAGFETEAEAKAVRDKLTTVIEILKTAGLTR